MAQTDSKSGFLYGRHGSLGPAPVSDAATGHLGDVVISLALSLPVGLSLPLGLFSSPIFLSQPFLQIPVTIHCPGERHSGPWQGDWGLQSVLTGVMVTRLRHT